MINKEEIESKSREFEIHPANVQRDYVFGWLLFGIFSISGLKDKIFLKGGNALRKGYFANTRYSSDLDFGIPGDIKPNVLLKELNRVCDFIQEKTYVTFVKDENRIKEKFVVSDTPINDLKIYEARIYFKDFYGNSDHFKIKISMDITLFDKVLLPIKTVNLIHPYSDKSEVKCKINCMKLEEIIATKLKCLLQRQHAPDLFDYVYSIKLLGGKLNKSEVVNTFIKKTIFEKNPHIVKDILRKTPFDFFKSFWNKSIICAKKFLFEAEEAISLFVADIEDLFEIYPKNRYKQFVYFGPKFRFPIIKAGREQTILKIRYNGSDREVEPYSLKYLMRRDGNAREYFYCYNCSGGSGEGIRCFVASGVESIENTDIRFEPRFFIELSKAGEIPENPFLFDPNKPANARRNRRVLRSATYRRNIVPKYIYQCNNCGKKFTKSINNGMLNPHKNKNGHPCGGRYGRYIDTKY